jgi:alanyl-tRNA synthetase
MHAHVAKVKQGSIKVWDKLHLKVHADLRADTMRNHTATHLLQSSLRAVLGEHVKQAGSLVEPGRYRFDFTHFSSVPREELDAVEDMVNQKIMANLPLQVEVKDIDEAMESGAIALFGEKYGDKVRIVSIPEFSSEFCGGTHVHATGDIGPFVIESEGSVASGIRRIEGSTGRVALARMREKERELKGIGELIKSDRPAERVKALLDELKALQREQEKLKAGAMKDTSGDIVEQAREINGVKVLSARVDGLNVKDLRGLADQVRDRMGSGVVVLASAVDGQASILATVTKDIAKTYKAGDILKQVAQSAGGRGGGKPDMAQGGTRELEKLDSALESVYDIIKGK